MIEVACTCDDLPPHSHLFAPDPPRRGFAPTYHDTGEVRIWVNWKDVARELAVDGNVQAR